MSDTGNHVIKSVDRGSGAVDTVAGKRGVKGLVDGRGGEAAFYNPQGVAVAPDGNLYIADMTNHAIRRMSTRSREVDTIWSGRSSSQAESSTELIGGVMTYQLGNVTGLWSPTSLAVWDVGGDFALLVADTDNHRIVRLTPPADEGVLDAEGAPLPLRMWTLSHFAGSGRRGMENGGAYSASFRYPHAIAVCMGEVNSGARGRERQSRLSESAMQDAGREAEVDSDPAQRVVVLVADTGNHVVRRVRAQDTALLAIGESSWGAAAQVETLAGDGTPGSEDSLTKREKPKASVLLSSVLTARFVLPQGIDCDGKGGALVADTYNQAVRHVGTGGITVTLAGGGRSGSADGSGTAAEFSEPVGIFFHKGERTAYVVEQGNQGLRKISVGDLSFTVSTSAASTGKAPRSTVRASALAGAAAAWLAWRRAGRA